MRALCARARHKSRALAPERQGNETLLKAPVASSGTKTRATPPAPMLPVPPPQLRAEPNDPVRH